jgi:hypothetical protein
MEKEAISNFEGQYVKLEYINGFNLRGTILKVYKESILFKTLTAKSIISLCDIKSITGVA